MVKILLEYHAIGECMAMVSLLMYIYRSQKYMLGCVNLQALKLLYKLVLKINHNVPEWIIKAWPVNFLGKCRHTCCDFE